MPISGINNSTVNQTNTGYDNASLTTTSPSENGAELVQAPVENAALSESVYPPSDGAFPEPPTTSEEIASRADYVENRLAEIEDVFEHLDELETLAKQGDKEAKALLDQLYSLEQEYNDLQEEAESLGGFFKNSDLDGDGVNNQFDPDIDGDNLTNEAELANGTNVFDIDSDHDGITDTGELFLQKNNPDFAFMDPNNPDSNQNGIIDGAELPASIATNGTGNSGNGGTTGTNTNTGLTTATYDPFNGAIPKNETESVGDNLVYDANGTEGTFTIPSSINGQEVQAVEVRVDGNDVYVVLKNSPNDAQALAVIKLKGGKDQIENSKISFQLADNGQYFYSPDLKTFVNGGFGNDYITIKGGHAKGDAGNDILRALDQAATLDGGQGDDLLEGGSGVDTLIGGGGEGMDAAYSGSSSGDHFDMGDGDDIAIVNNTSTNANYDIKMGAGVDMSNFTNSAKINNNSGIDVRMDDLDGLRAFLAGKTDDASGALLDALNSTEDNLEQGVQMAASSVRDGFLSLLSQKKSEQFSQYAGQTEELSSGDLPPPISDDE